MAWRYISSGRNFFLGLLSYLQQRLRKVWWIVDFVTTQVQHSHPARECWPVNKQEQRVHPAPMVFKQFMGNLLGHVHSGRAIGNSERFNLSLVRSIQNEVLPYSLFIVRTSTSTTLRPRRWSGLVLGGGRFVDRRSRVMMSVSHLTCRLRCAC